MSIDLRDYVDVAERIAGFRAKHPEGSLQSEILALPSDTFKFVVVRACAYRTPDDQRPGIGLAWEPFPGKTPYTRDSELMNAETSAWGRAIVAALAADTRRGIASKEEIEAAKSERSRGGEAPSQAAAVHGEVPGGAGAVGKTGPPAPSGPTGALTWAGLVEQAYGQGIGIPVILEVAARVLDRRQVSIAEAKALDADTLEAVHRGLTWSGAA